MPESLSKIDIGTLSQLSMKVTLANFLLAFALSLVIQYCYRRFGKNVANRAQISYIFPLITMTVFLIIIVVKSSLALSLGLVGALSIVRFRTPIKEPETLAYLFLTIAVGLGFAADRPLITLSLGALIVAYYAATGYFTREKENVNLFLNITAPKKEKPEQIIQPVNQILTKWTEKANLRRFDQGEKLVQATYLVDLRSSKNIEPITSELSQLSNDVKITFVDNNHLTLG